jgi:hypothetical protein
LRTSALSVLLFQYAPYAPTATSGPGPGRARRESTESGRLLQLRPHSSSPLSRLLRLRRAFNSIRVTFWPSTSIFHTRSASDFVGRCGPPLAVARGRHRSSGGDQKPAAPPQKCLLLVLLLPYVVVVRSYCSIPAKDSEYQKVSEKGKQDFVNKLVQSLLIIITH